MAILRLQLHSSHAHLPPELCGGYYGYHKIFVCLISCSLEPSKRGEYCIYGPNIRLMGGSWADGDYDLTMVTVKTA